MNTTFAGLGLSAPILAAIDELGYEAPTPIQAQTIGLLMEGRDVIGQAQTGTGKTAAFALPMLDRIDTGERRVQAIILTPTRELAVQVAEASHRYGRHKSVSVLPVYGGQPIDRQLRALRQGVQVVVGTPGRVMDHIRRGTLDLSSIRYLVLDEADEMLDMGFVEDIEWILQHVPGERQTALFSATMPPVIQRLAEKYMHDPELVSVAAERVTVPTTDQTYYDVAPRGKTDALTTILDHQTPSAAIVFTRTKVAAGELADVLSARGYSVEALHGDMSQAARDSVMRRFRSGQIELLIATDVAARGLDIENVSHVINYDIPSDPETYIHRIGRTGRAGRTGTAITLVTPRERRLMKDIERTIGVRIRPMKLPTAADIASRRIEVLKDSVRACIQEGGLDPYLMVVESLADEYDMAEVAAAALNLMANVDRASNLVVSVEPPAEETIPTERGMVRLFIDAGRKDGIRPADIVGAIANEANIPGRSIGAIDIYDRFSFVEIPERHRDEVLKAMGRTSLKGRDVTIRVATPRSDQGQERSYGSEAESRTPRRGLGTGRNGGGAGKRLDRTTRRPSTRRPPGRE